MNSNVHIVALCGSLREESYTRVALRHALDAAEESGATTDLVDMRTLNLPVFDADEQDVGDAPELRQRIRAADAVILGTPMYHGSFASPLKTALDYCGFDEFEGKTVGLLAVAGGQFPTLALEQLRTVCRALRAWTLPHQVGIPSAYEQFDDDAISDEEIADRVAELGRNAVQYSHIEEAPRQPTGEERVELPS